MNRLDSDLLTELSLFMIGTRDGQPYPYRITFPVRTGDTLTADITALSETGQTLATRALMAWTEVTGIHFRFVRDDDAQIVFTEDRGGGPHAQQISNHGDTRAIVNVPTVHHRNGTTPDSVDGEGFNVYLHEIGHALGLYHPGIYPTDGSHAVWGEHNVFANDSEQTTVMSYFYQGQNPNIDASDANTLNPMIADIIAIQETYGTPVLRAGDTRYGVGADMGGHLGAAMNDWTAGKFIKPVAFTLLDSGGIDTLDLSTDTEDQHMVLQSEVASDVYGLRGNLVIARDTLIENYIAGSGNDIIVGNEADNVLEGGPGADAIDGQTGLDTASYAGSDEAVTVSLLDGTATGGDAEGDTLTSIENLTGSAHADALTGDAGANVLEGMAGGDTLDGQAGADTASYLSSNAGVRIDLGSGTARGGHATGDRLANIEHLTGSRHNDALTGDAGTNRLDGGPGHDRLIGGAGADTLIGGTGRDTAIYADSPEAVTVNLLDGSATGGDAEGDTLTSIENLTGSAHSDALTGDAGHNVLEGGAGADILDGGDGIDTASYAGSPSRVDVRLSGTVVNHGDATGDTLSNIENLLGSAHNDTLAGDGNANRLTGLAGNDLLWGSGGDDLLLGGPGADRLVGGRGQDTASYAGSEEGVTVRLHSLSAKGGDARGDTFPYTVAVAYTDSDGVEQVDTLPDVERLIGSSHDDILAGDRRDNRLDGGAGDDTLYGGPGGGDDVMVGGAGNDRLYGGQGDDRLTGGSGDDRLSGGPGADVFVFGPGDGEDTVTDFGNGADRIDISYFEIESVDEVGMTLTDDGVVVDMTEFEGGTILLAGLTALPEAEGFIV